MANEITKIELFGFNRDGDAMRFVIASSAIITKGTLMKFADPRTASASVAAKDVIAGIACMDKAADWSTNITVWRNGIFDCKASGAITAGSPIMGASDANYPNTVMAAVTASQASGAVIMGYALETATDGEVIACRINL